MGGKHGPNRFANYQSIHETCIEKFVREGKILSHNLLWSAYGEGLLQLVGTILCEDEICLSVDKRIRVLDGEGASALVQTESYSYNAHFRGGRLILRYDSPHATHNQFHHVHRYSFPDGVETEEIEALETEDAIPTLSEVVDELMEWNDVRKWYQQNECAD